MKNMQPTNISKYSPMSTRKPTMAFVDHSFHQKTRSSDFLKDMLCPYFEITNYNDTSWCGGKNISPAELNKYDYVFFEQVLNPLGDLKKITAKIIWAPMYDGVKFDYFYWKTLSLLPVKIICFSEQIYLYCKRFGIKAVRAKYFINPAKYGEYDLPKKGNILFFWYRGSIRFEDLKNILNPNQIDKLIYKSNPDPNCPKETINKKDIDDFKIQIIEGGHSTKDEYLRLLSQANVFIAPRKKEGIGLSFLEAMAMGQCVIGNNDATMNEYITHENNGYLFDLKKPKTLDLSNINIVTARSREKNLQGYADWNNDSKKIVDFINWHDALIMPKYFRGQLFFIFIKLWSLKLLFKKTLYSLMKLKKTIL